MNQKPHYQNKFFSARSQLRGPIEEVSPMTTDPFTNGTPQQLLRCLMMFVKEKSCQHGHFVEDKRSGYFLHPKTPTSELSFEDPQTRD